MALKVFNPRKKQVLEAETEMSLPPFQVDINDYLMFDDPDLGGCGIFEITPRVWDTSWTHLDGHKPTDVLDDDDLTDSDGVRYQDMRRLIVPVWVKFLNNLLPKDNNTAQTHIQILGKKTRLDPDSDPKYFWYTELDYLLSQTTKHMGTPTNEAMRVRMLDYALMLGRLSAQSHTGGGVFDPTKLSSFDTKWYIIVSYTPSSEGWWYDGRDSDYYMVEDSLDMKHPLSMFSDPQFVDKIAARIGKRQQKKQAAESVNTAWDMFPLATDLTTSVLNSRMRDLERSYMRLARDLSQGLAKEYNARYPKRKIALNSREAFELGYEAMPFTMRRLNGREVAALVAFFPDILTPYWDKALTQLEINMTDVLYALDSDNAILTHDISYVEQYEDDVLIGDVNIDTTDDEVASFRERYANPDTDLFGSDDYDEEDADDVFQQWGFATNADERELWGQVGMDVTTAEEDAETEFLKRHGRRSINARYRQQNARIRKEMQDQGSGDNPDDFAEWFSR